MDEEGSSGTDRLDEPSVADALVSSYGWVEAAGDAPPDDSPPTTPIEDVSPETAGDSPAASDALATVIDPPGASDAPNGNVAAAMSAPPRPDAPPTAALEPTAVPEQPGPPKPVQGDA